MPEKDLLADYTKTVKEIAAILKCAPVTVVRKRRALGISGPRGSKKGIAKGVKTAYTMHCVVCHGAFLNTPSDTDRKYCSKKCMGACPEYRSKLKTIDRSYMQTEAYRKAKVKESTPSYRKYSNRVQTLSQRTYLEHIDIINPNNYPRALAGTVDGWQLDHIKTVRECFDNNVSAEECSSVSNLRMLPWRDNLARNKKS